MNFDYGSVLLAVGASGAALSFTLFTNWMRQRRSGFLMTWSASIGVIVLAVIAFAMFSAIGSLVLGALACILLTTGIAIHYGGLVQFRDGTLPVHTVVVLSLTMALPMVAAFAGGMDGLGFWLVNSFSAALLTYCGWGYWRMRAESPTAISAIALLHYILAFSFFLCVVVGVQEAPLYLVDGSPQNWAELVNLVVSVIALTGIGGLLVTVHQERISRHHKHDALTDPLTGLSNRRALFDLYQNMVPQNTAIIVLDLDEFKALNDTFGHSVGDIVLKNFAQLLTSLVEPGDLAIRLGGEEFVLVLPDRKLTDAILMAERIRSATARLSHDIQGKRIRYTVSAGVAVADREGKSLDTLLRKADNALYHSKRKGRNQVSTPDTRAA